MTIEIGRVYRLTCDSENNCSIFGYKDQLVKAVDVSGNNPRVQFLTPVGRQHPIGSEHSVGIWAARMKKL